MPGFRTVLVFERDLGTMLRNVVSTGQANDFHPWASVAAISRSHLPPNIVYPVVHHIIVSLLYLNVLDDKESINSLNNRKDMLSAWSTPVRMLSVRYVMNFGCSARSTKFVMVSQQQHVAESVSDEPYGNVVPSSLSVILDVSERIWAFTDTCVELFAFFLLWDDAFVFDKKNRLLRAITVPAIKR